MIKTYRSGSFITQGSLLEALEIGQKRNPVISVVGAGGKTTLITLMAEEYLKRRIPVIVTTTTHMRAENRSCFLLEEKLDTALEMIHREGMVWLGLPDKNGKMKAPRMEFMQQLQRLNLPILIEADGAKELPLKAPEKHEPVLLPETDCVVNVYGLDAIGEQFREICFRAETAVDILKRKMTDTVRAEDIARLALSSLGGRKGITPSMEYRVILNKADTPEREKAALDICKLAESQGLTKLTITARERQ